MKNKQDKYTIIHNCIRNNFYRYSYTKRTDSFLQRQSESQVERDKSEVAHVLSSIALDKALEEMLVSNDECGKVTSSRLHIMSDDDMRLFLSNFYNMVTNELMKGIKDENTN